MGGQKRAKIMSTWLLNAPLGTNKRAASLFGTPEYLYKLECVTIFSNSFQHSQTEPTILLLFQYLKSKISENLDQN